MKAIVFPGQGSQYVGMGEEFLGNERALEFFNKAKEILGFDILEIMVSGSEDDLKETKVTQPAVFLHGIVKYYLSDNEHDAHAFAGHSLGEISALVAAECLSFEDGLTLVLERALAMQYACELKPSTMAAVLGLEDDVIREACSKYNGDVVPANFNCPGQVVISGLEEAIDSIAVELSELGARRVIKLKVGGAFHSPQMLPASERLNKAIDSMSFSKAILPVYQNYDAKPHVDPEEIATNLKKQLVSPVLWTNLVQSMINDGLVSFVESGGKGNVLAGLIRKIDRSAELIKL